MSERTRSRDGTEIAFERSGVGPTVVIVGGALNDRSAAASLAAALSDGFTVVVYDRRGRGDSGDTPPYSVEREVEDLEAILGLVDRPASVLGHSSGAVLALDAAARGLPIARLALYEPPFVVDDTRPPLPDDYVERLDALVGAGARGDAVAYFLTVGVGLPAETVEQMRSAPVWPSMEALAHTIAYDGRVMGQTMSGAPLPAGRWASVRIPALVMDGGASPPWQRNAVGALVDVLPNATRRTLPGQGHGPADEILAPVVAGFFGTEHSRVDPAHGR